MSRTRIVEIVVSGLVVLVAIAVDVGGIASEPISKWLFGVGIGLFVFYWFLHNLEATIKSGTERISEDLKQVLEKLERIADKLDKLGKLDKLDTLDRLEKLDKLDKLDILDDISWLTDRKTDITTLVKHLMGQSVSKEGDTKGN